MAMIYFAKIFLILLLLANMAHASWYDYRRENNIVSKNGDKCRSMGWLFYCQEDKAKDDTHPSYEMIKQLPLEQRYQMALRRQEQWREQEKARLALAITYPDAEHTRLWQEHKEAVSKQASLFSKELTNMLLGNPELDYTVKHPVSSTGSYIATDIRNNKKLDLLANLDKDYGLYFLYSTSCKYCVAYGKILNEFRRKFKLSIMGISMDGSLLTGWEDSLINNGQAEQLGVGDALPFTLLFDKKMQQVIPLGAGLITEDVLMERIYTQIGVDND